MCLRISGVRCGGSRAGSGQPAGVVLVVEVAKLGLLEAAQVGVAMVLFAGVEVVGLAEVV